MTKFKDLFHLDEDDRIREIGTTVMSGRVVYFATDDDAGELERYISKLQKLYPQVRIMWQGRGLVEGTMAAQVGPPLQ